MEEHFIFYDLVPTCHPQNFFRGTIQILDNNEVMFEFILLLSAMYDILYLK